MLRMHISLWTGTITWHTQYGMVSMEPKHRLEPIMLKNLPIIPSELPKNFTHCS